LGVTVHKTDVALSAQLVVPVYQMDVGTAFLSAKLDKEVYIKAH